MRTSSTLWTTRPTSWYGRKRRTWSWSRGFFWPLFCYRTTTRTRHWGRNRELPWKSWLNRPCGSGTFHGSTEPSSTGLVPYEPKCRRFSVVTVTQIIKHILFCPVWPLSVSFRPYASIRSGLLQSFPAPRAGQGLGGKSPAGSAARFVFYSFSFFIISVQTTNMFFFFFFE